MEPRFHLGDDLNDLERALHELAPTRARLDVAQTMFRAGQAAARRPRGSRLIWPVTSAALAVISLTLGALLVFPDQPRIVYVYRFADRPATAEPARITDQHSPRIDRGMTVAANDRKVDHVTPEARWLTPLSHVRSGSLAIDSLWSLTPTTMSTTLLAKPPALCSRDWPSLLEDSEARKLPKTIETAPRRDWIDLLRLQGI